MSANSAILPSAGRQNEPSMEEILASIRRIISDDTSAAQKEEAPASISASALPMQDLQEQDDDILDLAQVSTTTVRSSGERANHAPHNAMTSLENALGFSKPVQPAPAQAPALQSVSQLEERILSQETGAVVSQAIQSLARHAASSAVYGRSMEEVVVEALRPVLRTWLDDHLPGIVERLVKAEIERVTRGY